MTVFLNFNFLFFILCFPYFIFILSIFPSFFSPLFFSSTHVSLLFFFFISFFPLFPNHFLHTRAFTCFLYFLLSTFSLPLHTSERSAQSYALSFSIFFLPFSLFSYHFVCKFLSLYPIKTHKFSWCFVDQNSTFKMYFSDQIRHK